MYPDEAKKTLQIKVFLPGLKSAENDAATLDLAEDRVVFEAEAANYALDVNLPRKIEAEKAVAEFDQTAAFLSIKAPFLAD